MDIGTSHIPFPVIINSANLFGNSGERPISKLRIRIGLFEILLEVLPLLPLLLELYIVGGICLANLRILNCVVTRLHQARPKLGMHLSRT